MALSLSPLHQDLSCPICLDIFTDPVILSCGHSFCRACLQKSWTDNPVKECAVCRRRLSREHPPQDVALRNACETYIQQKRDSDSDSPGLRCSLHSEKLTLFCVYDEMLVCGQCVSQDHENHSFCSVNKAAGPHKLKIENHLTALKMRLEMFQKVKEISDQEAVHIKSQAKNTATQIQEEFKMLHQFLIEEEEARFAELRKEENEKSQRMNKTIEELDKAIKELSARIAETEEKLEDEVLLLQDVQMAYERAQYRGPVPELHLVSPIDVAKHLGNLRFRVWEKMKTICPYFPVVLDPNTANSTLSISANLSSFAHSAENLQLPDNPERISAYKGVLGSEGFSSGTHSWEVEVGDSKDWVVGVAEESVRKKEACVAAPENGFCCIGRAYDDVITAKPGINSGKDVSKASAIKTIRVTLNWEKGRVIFSSNHNNTTLYTFKHRFTKKIYPYFYNGSTNSGQSLRILSFPTVVSVKR